ncbi:hypothetical protein ACOMHN_053799 [Nucella lapillus]
MSSAFNRSTHTISFGHRKTKEIINKNTATHSVGLKRSSSVCTDTVSVNGTEIKEITSRNASQVLENYDTILLDCDGVLWRTDHITPLPGIQAAMEALQGLGKQILFVTNNSMHARGAYIQKFHQHGFHAPVEDVFCVAYASAVYLQTIIHVSGSVYVIGSPGMAEELSLAGIRNCGVGPDPDPVYHDIYDLLSVPLQDDVQAVLVGYDKHFNMRKLFKACSYLSDDKCLYLATNDKEKSVFVGSGRRQPLTGAIVDCVTSASKRRPEVLGKPDTHLFDCIMATHPGVDRGRCLMVGDSVPVDIGLARAVGMDSALVLTGASSLHSLHSHPGLEPSFFMKSLAVLASASQ